MQLPSVDAVNDTRVARFMTRITETLAGGQIDMYRDLLQRYEAENNVPAIDIAAAMAKLLQGDAPFLLTPPVRGAREDAAPRERHQRADRGDRPRFEPKFERGPRADGERAPRPPRGDDAGGERPRRDPVAPRGEPELGMESYRIEVGHSHGVKPANIVGAIANEAGLESRYIGRIDIQDDYSILDLPADMPRELLTHLKKVCVRSAAQHAQAGRGRGSRVAGQAALPAWRQAVRSFERPGPSDGPRWRTAPQGPAEAARR